MTLTQEILKRDGYRCQYCNGRATEADHILAKAEARRAGIRRDNRQFIVAACHDCNGLKGTRRILPQSWSVERVAELAKLTGRPWMQWDGKSSLGVLLR